MIGSLIKDFKYTWIQDEVTFYAYEFVIEVRVAELVATFYSYPYGLTCLSMFS